MIVCEEMQKLRDILDNCMIQWWDCSEDMSSKNIAIWICRTRFNFYDTEVSVINGMGTYGGYSTNEKDNKGLLEVWCKYINDGEVQGYMTADEIIRELADKGQFLDVAEQIEREIEITELNEKKH